ncbi:MAG: hypothetical protein ICV83_30820 [Cytophagales bacterium]|nr:hypothetical protein [Cytophagales bacterium]
MALRAGTVNDFDNSMASKMAEAFAREWFVAMNEQPFPGMNDQTRLMFAAIAQGVVEYLKANPGAFRVSVANSSAGTLNGAVTEIQ